MTLEQPTFDANQPAASRSSSPLRSLALLSLGLVAGAGGVLLLRRPAPVVAGQPEAKKQMYQCPMHLQIIQDHLGTCPICAMDLVPIEQVQGGA